MSAQGIDRVRGIRTPSTTGRHCPCYGPECIGFWSLFVSRTLTINLTIDQRTIEMFACGTKEVLVNLKKKKSNEKTI